MRYPQSSPCVYKPTFFLWVAPLCNYEKMEVNQSKALRVAIITLMIVVRVIIINDSYLMLFDSWVWVNTY